MHYTVFGLDLAKRVFQRKRQDPKVAERTWCRRVGLPNYFGALNPYLRKTFRASGPERKT